MRQTTKPTPQQQAQWADRKARSASKKFANKFAHSLRMRPDSNCHETGRGECRGKACMLGGGPSRRFVIFWWVPHPVLPRCGAVHGSDPRCVHCTVADIDKQIKGAGIIV